MLIYLVRHGETFASKLGDMSYGDQILTAPILPEAVPALQKIATFLQDKETDFNVSSELFRCKQTAQIITDTTKKEFVFDQNLNEYMEAQGETFEQLRERIQAFLLTIQKYSSVLIVTHGAGVAAIKHLVLTGEFEEKNLHDYPKTGEMTIIKNNTSEVLNFRD